MDTTVLQPFFMMAQLARFALLLIAYWGLDTSCGSKKDISEEDYYKSKS